MSRPNWTFFSPVFVQLGFKFMPQVGLKYLQLELKLYKLSQLYVDFKSWLKVIVTPVADLDEGRAGSAPRPPLGDSTPDM